jgi:outer membrane protein TolC
MNRVLFALAAFLSLAAASLSYAQSPTPTPFPASLSAPDPTPTPVPASLAAPSPTPLSPPPNLESLSPAPTPLPSPFPAPTVFPTPPPVTEPSPLVLPSPTPDPSLIDNVGIPESFGDPGPIPSRIPTPIVPQTSGEPDAATIAKSNAEAIKRINDYAASIRNANVPNMSPDQAIDDAIRQNPDILNAIEQIRITRGQIIEVRAQALPQLDFTSAYQQQQQSLVDPKRPGGGGGETLTIPGPDGENIELDLGGGGSGAFVNPKTWNIQFQASQLIYNGGAVIAGIRAAKFAEDSAYFSLRQTIDRVIADVRKQFYQVVLNRALIVAQQQSVELLAEQLKDQQNRYEAGTVPRFNVLQAEVALANAKPPLIQAVNNLRISQYQLVRLLGMDYKTSKPSEVPFNVVGDLAYRPRSINVDESIRTSIERNPALKAQRQNILVQAENVKVQFAGYLPTVSATAGYIWENNQAFQSLGEINQGWTIGFQGSWAIFDGFETAGRTAQARAQLEQSVINYDNGVRQVILDVQQAISNLQTAKETIESQEASVVQATEALRLARERLDAGAGTQLDVLNAQVALLQAQTTVLQARYDYISATADYDLALSINAEYPESFADPLTPREQKKYQVVTAPDAPQPPLPKKLRDADPIQGLAANAPPQPTPKGKRAAPPAPAPDSKNAPAPSQTPEKRKRFLGIF